MSKRALITGIGGQDGFFLSELLLSKGYEVFGISNRPLKQLLSTDPAVYSKVKMFIGDLLDEKFIENILAEVMPDEIYHFAAQSNVGASYSCAQETYRVNTVGSLQLFEQAHMLVPNTRIYFAGSSEMFGNAPNSPQDETTPFRPKSPYGMSKVAAYYSAKYHRESCGQFISTGITYNHESERRPVTFVTQKICYGISQCINGNAGTLSLGNLSSIRDWGFAGDYVEAMWLLLQQNSPTDAIISTGVGHSVEDFANCVAKSLDVSLTWEGEGINRVAKNLDTGNVIVNVTEEFYRQSESVPLIGNPAYLKQLTGWIPKMSFEGLVNRMVKYAVAGKSEAV